MAQLPSTLTVQEFKGIDWPADGIKVEKSDGTLVNLRPYTSDASRALMRSIYERTPIGASAPRRRAGMKMMDAFTHEVFYEAGTNIDDLYTARWDDDTPRWFIWCDGVGIKATRTLVENWSVNPVVDDLVKGTASHQPDGDPIVEAVTSFNSDQADISQAISQAATDYVLPDASDGVGDLTYELTGISGLSSAVFNATTRVLTLNTAQADIDSGPTHIVTYKVTDEFGYGTTQTFTITATS